MQLWSQVTNVYFFKWVIDTNAFKYSNQRELVSFYISSYYTI